MAKINFDVSDREVLGFVWVDNQVRPFYSIREIMRGKKKGQFAVEILGMSDNKLCLKMTTVERADLFRPKRDAGSEDITN